MYKTNSSTPIKIHSTKTLTVEHSKRRIIIENNIKYNKNIVANCIFNMIILIVETYNLNIINPSVALDNYFGSNQYELKTWLKKLNYSVFMSNQDFQKRGIPKTDCTTHAVLVGVNAACLGNNNKIIIYPFDKFSIVKNELIKEILSNQLSLHG